MATIYLETTLVAESQTTTHAGLRMGLSVALTGSGQRLNPKSPPKITPGPSIPGTVDLGVVLLKPTDYITGKPNG